MVCFGLTPSARLKQGRSSQQTFRRAVSRTMELTSLRDMACSRVLPESVGEMLIVRHLHVLALMGSEEVCLYKLWRSSSDEIAQMRELSGKLMHRCCLWQFCNRLFRRFIALAAVIATGRGDAFWTFYESF